ncbi:MAG: hypothetical protein Q7J78_02795, partial [Clostridiales bacterium]|nr:hypothetical protein [Clostridiales bacterium]
MAMKSKHIVENEVLSVKVNPLNNPLLNGNGEIIIGAGFAHPLWVKWKEDLEKIVLKHKWCFPDYEKGKISFKAPDVGEGDRHESRYFDGWGCEWHKVTYWDVGQIQSHPLADKSKFMEYCPPDPLVIDEWGMKHDWDGYAKGITDIYTGLRIFERTHFLMGMENMMIALAEGDQYVEKIIGMIVQHNMVFINNKLKYGKPNKLESRIPTFADDLGDQRTLLIRPALWRRYFKPGYRAMFSA